jgi:hypothetical protein
MNGLLSLPEPPTTPPPKESRRRIYVVLLTVLLASVLVFALVIVFPPVTNPPSPQMTSSDWSGYSVASNLNNPQPQVTSVSASWKVPVVGVSVGDSSSAAWIGVGGQYEYDETLIQTGTEHDSISGRSEYSAWYELLPYGSAAIDSLSVSPGDVITASISLLNQDTNTWSIEINDTTNGQSFKKNVTYTSSMLSAEWIVERPTINNRITTLANFGQIAFTNCKATVGGKAGTISDFPSNQITMQNRQNIVLVTVSTTSSGGSSFTVTNLD